MYQSKQQEQVVVFKRIYQGGSGIVRFVSVCQTVM